MRTVASELSAAVSVSEFAHPDKGSANAHNLMRSEAILRLLEEQTPEMTTDGKIAAMVDAGVRASKIMSYVVARSDVNITARACMPGSSRKVVSLDWSGTRGGGGGGAGSDAARNPYDKGYVKPVAPTPTPGAGLSRQERNERRKAFAIHVVASVEYTRSGKACHNCGDTEHFWLACPKPYNKQRWQAAVDEAGATSRLGRIAPRTEEYYADMQKRFAARSQK
jgi:hypothetical protein